MAAQRYCMLTTCRRKFLLDYFGEKNTPDKCGLDFTLHLFLFEIFNLSNFWSVFLNQACIYLIGGYSLLAVAWGCYYHLRGIIFPE